MEKVSQRNYTKIKTKKIFQHLVLNVLEKMPKGKLNLFLPSGEKLTFGDPSYDGIDHVADMTIHQDEFFKSCVLYADIGLGESYVDGLWDTSNITQLIKWFILNIDYSAHLSGGNKKKWSPLNILQGLNRLGHKARKNTISQGRKNISFHYDLSNDLYKTFLDSTMAYSSGIFTEQMEETLVEAQQKKYDSLAKSLELTPGMTVLEIGCGWGGMAKFLVENYHVKMTCLTISEQQYKYCQELFKSPYQDGTLADMIDLQFLDYRLVQGSFDRIISIEMLEAVGHEFLPNYFKKCHEVLSKDGLIGLQVITSPDSRYEEFRNNVDWIQKHIFPGSLLPSIGQMVKVFNDVSDLQISSLKEFGRSYARTLEMWRESFNQHLREIEQLGMDQAFIRKWNYYFSYCEAAFFMRNISVVQMVLTRPNRG